MLYVIVWFVAFCCGFLWGKDVADSDWVNHSESMCPKWYNGRNYIIRDWDHEEQSEQGKN